MSERNLYAPGNEADARHHLHGRHDEQVAYARQELDNVHVPDSVDHLADSSAADPPTETGEGMNLADMMSAAGNTAVTLDTAAAQRQPNQDSISQFSQLESVADDGDPAKLFSIVEDATQSMERSSAVLNAAAAEGGGEGMTGHREQTEQHMWDRARRWLLNRNNNDASIDDLHNNNEAANEQIKAAAYVRGHADATVLHLMCKLHNPPADVIAAVLAAAPEVASWTDNHGWLPLHHACANGASTEVLRLLCEAYPEGKLTQDNQNRTALHFYATRNTDHPAVMQTNTELLSDSGAAELSDRGGLLPMHYACAYGTHPAVLQVLAQASPTSLSQPEAKGRTPMHLAMVNAHRDASPSVIAFLLEHAAARATINTRDQDGYLPLHLLALGLRGYKADDPDKKANVAECLSMYLEAEPVAAADFLTAIQDLPEWLQDTAVVSKHVRNVLNRKIIQRFPTSILMLDGYFLILIIVCFELTTRNHINIRFDPENYEDTTQGELTVVFVGASYFLLRELVQIISLMSLGSLGNWFHDPNNLLDMAVIVLVFYYGTLMVDDELGISDSGFRTGVAFTKGVLWAAVIVYLKSTLVDFAVFVGGVFYVVQRLAAFLMAVGVILLAFAQMFFFVYVETDICEVPDREAGEDGLNLSCRFPHCTFWESLLKVYTMMMGEIGDETRYSTNLVAQILYVGYAFLVVILLSNVLIAIVTDSYEVIQNDRAAIVFWSNRLDFIAEMDAVTYGINKRFKGCFGRAKPLTSELQEMPSIPDTDAQRDTTSAEGSDRFREAWQLVMALFDSNLYDEVDAVEFWVYMVFRVFAIVFIIPLWLALGVVTAGWLWPPQVRYYLFVQLDTKISRAELERQKLEKLKAIQTDIKTMKQEVTREMVNDRDEMIRMKAEVETVQGEVLQDLLQVKELMTSLLGA